MKPTTSNTTIGGVCKRDRVFAYATKDTEIVSPIDGQVIPITEGTQIEGSGHWDDDDGIYVYLYDLQGQPVNIDVVLPYSDWNFSIAVKFERHDENQTIQKESLS